MRGISDVMRPSMRWRAGALGHLLLASARSSEDRARSQLRARIAGQVAWVLNVAGRYAEAEAQMIALPDGPDVPPFARARRANGLAYVRHRLGDTDGATARWPGARRATPEMLGTSGCARWRC